jgi:hypothetical protein
MAAAGADADAAGVATAAEEDARSDAAGTPELARGGVDAELGTLEEHAATATPATTTTSVRVTARNDQRLAPGIADRCLTRLASLIAAFFAASRS